ncbi:alcohol dehydrogenase [Clostridiales bacterium COT073_COT-073]|nr:alcohol dehydrogenase [Clostridiales bacterium COT073_COT-073]
MKAAVYTKEKGIHLEDVPVPVIQKDTDVIVRVIYSTICGSDIHINSGVYAVEDGLIIGHEFVGEVIEVGKAVKKLKVGDKVAANCITTCGECYYCKHGYTNHCENGGWNFGYKINGCQAEYIRVPFADNGLYKISPELDLRKVLFVGDILSTGYFGAIRGDIQPGDTVVVLGAGPVGMCAMASARLFGPAQIIAVDVVDYRLEIAKREGVADLVLNSSQEDIEAYVKEVTDGRGADVVIECAGVKATFDLSWKIARPNGTVSIVALYGEVMELPLNIMAGKNLTIRSGWVDSIYMQELICLIEKGKLNVDFLMTHEAPLNDILKGYDIFGNKKENCMKWVISPYVE